MSTLWINGVIYLEAFIDFYLHSKLLASFDAVFCLPQNNQGYIEQTRYSSCTSAMISFVIRT